MSCKHIKPIKICKMHAKKPSLLVQICNFRHFVLSKFKIKDIEIVLLMLEAVGFRDYCVSFAETPVQHNLHCTFVIFLSETDEILVGWSVSVRSWNDRISLSVSSWSCHRSISNWSYIFSKQKSYEFFLLAIYIQFNLIDNWWNFSIAE